MAQQREKLDWNVVDTDAFKGDMATKYAKFVKAHEAQVAAWNDFMAMAQPKADANAPEGMVAVLVHKWGKLRIAFKEAPKSAPASKDAVTL